MQLRIHALHTSWPFWLIGRCHYNECHCNATASLTLLLLGSQTMPTWQTLSSWVHEVWNPHDMLVTDIITAIQNISPGIIILGRLSLGWWTKLNNDHMTPILKIPVVDPTSPWFTWVHMKIPQRKFAKVAATFHDNIFLSYDHGIGHFTELN